MSLFRCIWDHIQASFGTHLWQVNLVIKSSSLWLYMDTHQEQDRVHLALLLKVSTIFLALLWMQYEPRADQRNSNYWTPLVYRGIPVTRFIRQICSYQEGITYKPSIGSVTYRTHSTGSTLRNIQDTQYSFLLFYTHALCTQVVRDRPIQQQTIRILAFNQDIDSIPEYRQKTQQ